MKMEIEKVPRLFKMSGDPFCVDDCISTYAHYIGIDYEIIYLGALRTPYSVSNGELVLQEFGFLDDIKESCGIHIDIIKWNSSTEMLERIKEEISNGNVVSIDLAGYYCPWDWRYQEIDMEDSNHEFFVVNVNNEKKELFCVDPYYEKKDVILPYDCCCNGCREIKVFKYEQSYLDDIELICRIELEKDSWEKCFQDLDVLGDKMEKYIEESICNLNTDEDLATTYVEVNKNVIYCILEAMSNNRIRFAWFIKYLEKKSIIQGGKLADEFIDISKIWSNIKRMFVKSLYRGQFDAEKFRGKIMEVGKYEKNILEELLYLIHNENIQKKREDYVRKKLGKEQYHICNINNYYNNKGILCDSNQKADFNGLGEYLSTSKFPQDQIIYYQHTPFFIQSVKAGEDNIVCQKQKLAVPVKKYHKVCFLACSDWGDCKDFFQLQYKDKTIDNNLIDIYEWVPNKDGIQDNICFISQKVLKNTKYEFERCYIYYYELLCNYDKELAFIRLPYCENIHVFAVTLVDYL
jgi:hypothetical protein